MLAKTTYTIGLGLGPGARVRPLAQGRVAAGPPRALARALGRARVRAPGPTPGWPEIGSGPKPGPGPKAIPGPGPQGGPGPGKA